MYGSGIVRHIIVLYDVANQEFYSLGDDDNAYFIISFEDGHLSVGFPKIYPNLSNHSTAYSRG